jgi:predicted transposase YdaD
MDSAIMAANERQYFVIQDEEARRAYWSIRGAEHDRISGLNGARMEGEQKKAIEIARNALAKGSSIEFVHDITGLDKETIASLN